MKFSNYFKNYYINIFDRIYISEDALLYKESKKAIERLSLPVKEIVSAKDIPEEHLNSKTLFITKRKGALVTRCPGTRRHICCNYLTVDLYEGCTLGCSYCIMKSYLNFSPITVYVDSSASIEEIKRIALSNKDRIVRVGTGEVGDSLQFDPLFEMSADFIQGLADTENVYFEAKTKTCFVDHLLEIKNKGNGVISFSLNPEEIILTEETEAFSLDNRLDAATKAVKAGYNLAFHFDPVICEEEWEKRYLDTIEKLSVFPKEKIKWISIGTLRYPPDLKEKIAQAERPYLFDEFVPCADGKYRYLQRRRKEVYRKLYNRLKEVTNSSIYFCMESDTIWNYAAGNVPGKIPETTWLFKKISDMDVASRAATRTSSAAFLARVGGQRP
ncbi:MAG: radical SAM protein [Spirochaetaceae bacterium]|nr:radical SAM protein [Spirochaetaceae bacterium]